MATPTFEQLTELHKQAEAGRITRENIQAFLRNPDLYLNGTFPSFIYAVDLIPEYTDKNGNKRKWDILEDVAPSQFDTSKLKPRSFLKDSDRKGHHIDGNGMRTRAVEFKGNLGLSDGRRQLAEQDKIPTEFQGFYIPLSGTLLRDSRGLPYVAYLDFRGDRWYLDFVWLYSDWSGGGRFACSE